MTEQKYATFTARQFADDYRLEYASYAGPRPGEWYGTFRVWKGNVKIASASLNTPCGAPGMAQTMAHNVGLSLMETDKRE
ncbi:hypothetical protein ASD15_14320 [Massilia sp. Root351]|jgi:hypothetical protein|uniref:hypothetical protein n=1 Tax=Massilia sp. Root351 TaxID=1736522 RepID=UPI000711073B|nr:hypothetical protein [Massilia sp. Root351]KQV81052.1 hypothetical protein ASD15_14320 [Massilia sp. Root351]